MKILTPLISILFSFTLISCGDKESTSSSADGNPGGGGSSHLVRYDKDIGSILSKERLGTVIDLAGIEAEQKIVTVGKMRVAQWTWPSDRKMKMKMAGQEVEYAVENTVAVNQFEILGEEGSYAKDGKSYVENTYRSISKEEMAKVAENMKRIMEDKVKKGEITEEQAKLAGGIGGGFMGKERVVETIEDVADACRWVATDNTLAVGHKNVFFTLVVDISADSAVNRGKAIELAKVILADEK